MIGSLLRTPRLAIEAKLFILLAMAAVFMEFCMLVKMIAQSLHLAVPLHSIGRHTDLVSLLTVVIGLGGAVLVGRSLWSYRKGVAIAVGLVLALCFTAAVQGTLHSGHILGLLLGLVPWWLAFRFLRLSGDYRGWAGERRVQRVLRRWLRQEQGGRLFNDLLLPAGEHSTEIDHLLVSRRGVFVIETKGGRHVHVTEDGRWFRGSNETLSIAMHSPLEQNAGHVRAVRKVIGDAPVVPLVVLTQKQVSGFMPQGVMQPEVLPGALSRYAPDRLDTTRMEALIGQVERAAITDPAARKRHRADLKARFGAAG